MLCASEHQVINREMRKIREKPTAEHPRPTHARYNPDHRVPRTGRPTPLDRSNASKNLQHGVSHCPRDDPAGS